MNAGDREGRAPQESSALAPVSGLILCGGRSRRMGSDKAELDLSGRALLDRLIEQVSPVVGELKLACGERPRYGDRGLDLLLDEEPGAGPLAAIATALEATGFERMLVVACDMPRLTSALLRELVRRSVEERLDVCWFESERGLEPMCAVYSRRCVGLMRAALERDQRRMTGFVDDSLRVARVRENDLPGSLRGRDHAVNLNTPEQLAAERSAWDEEEQP